MNLLFMIFEILLGIIFILTGIAALITIWSWVINELKEQHKNKEDE